MAFLNPLTCSRQSAQVWYTPGRCPARTEYSLGSPRFRFTPAVMTLLVALDAPLSAPFTEGIRDPILFFDGAGEYGEPAMTPAIESYRGFLTLRSCRSCTREVCLHREFQGEHRGLGAWKSCLKASRGWQALGDGQPLGSEARRRGILEAVACEEHRVNTMPNSLDARYFNA